MSDFMSERVVSEFMSECVYVRLARPGGRGWLGSIFVVRRISSLSPLTEFTETPDRASSADTIASHLQARQLHLC
jgi:hypothetical protein